MMSPEESCDNRKMPVRPLLRHAVAVVVLLVAVTMHGASVETVARRRAVGPPPPVSELQIYALAGDDPRLTSNDDLEPLRMLIGDASVVGLGESYHTSAGFYRMKHRIFRFLVEEMGFRAFAIESLWQGAERANTYVQTCQGTPEQAIRDHSTSGRAPNTRSWCNGYALAHYRGHAPDTILPMGIDLVRPYRDYDGIIFLQHSPKMRPLLWLPCR